MASPLDLRRLLSIAALGWAFARHLWDRVTAWIERRPAAALEAFADRYRRDGVRFVTAEDRAYSPALGACTACRACDPVCPVVPAAAGLGFVGPSRLVLANRRLLPAEPGAWQDAFTCIRCGACDRACPEGVPLDRMIGDMRRTVARETPEAVPTGLRDLLARAELRGHLTGEPPPAPRREDGLHHDHTYVPSCAACPRDVAAEAALLEKAGLDFGSAPARCCGALGARGAGERWTGLSDALAAGKAFHVVTSDPRCYEHMRASPLYKELHVLHVLELTGELKAEGKTAPVTFHDPCQLSRVPGGPELARDAIRRAGAELREMRLHGREAPCCGMGGGTYSFAPELAEELGRGRVRDAARTGAGVLLTQSPLCRDHLARCAALEGLTLEVKNVTELLAERLGAALPPATKPETKPEAKKSEAAKPAAPAAATIAAQPAPAAAPTPSSGSAPAPAAPPAATSAPPTAGASAPALATTSGPKKAPEPRTSPDPERARKKTPDPASASAPAPAPGTSSSSASPPASAPPPASTPEPTKGPA